MWLIFTTSTIYLLFIYFLLLVSLGLVFKVSVSPYIGCVSSVKLFQIPLGHIVWMYYVLKLCLGRLCSVLPWKAKRMECKSYCFVMEFSIQNTKFVLFYIMYHCPLCKVNQWQFSITQNHVEFTLCIFSWCTHHHRLEAGSWHV